MATASDLAEWWEENRKYTGEWANRPLSEFVQKHPNFFAVSLATTAQTVVEFPMAVGAGFVDILNLGKGTAEGGWGYLQDALRFVSALAPLARGGQAIISRVLAMNSGNNCAWIAAAKALMQTGTRAYALVGDLAKAAGNSVGGVGSVTELIAPLTKLGARVRTLAQPNTVIDVIAAANANPKGSLIFGVRWENAAFSGPSNPLGGAGHALVASWDAARGFLIADRYGKVVKTLSELESLYPGIGAARLSGGMVFIENAMIPQASLMKAAVTGSLMDALAMEVKIVFSPTPEVVQAMKNKPSVQIGEPGVVGYRQTYTVQPGDWLSKIAQSKYSGKREPALLWPILHDANRAVIGDNPNVLKTGQKLIIPDISSYSEAQLHEIRKRGLNWRR